MEPITLELSKRDLILLENALQKDEAFKIIRGYLETIDPVEREEVESVYLNFERTIQSKEQESRIEKHKFNMYFLLVEHGLIEDKKVFKKHVLNKSKNRKQSRLKTEARIKRLNRYRELTGEIETLHNRLHSLELELKNYDSVTVTTYKSEKVNTSKSNYNFGSFKISSEIDAVKDIIHKKVIKWEEERNYLNDIFEQIEDVKVQQVFYHRYLNGYSMDEISIEVNKSKVWCSKKHSEYIKNLQL